DGTGRVLRAGEREEVAHVAGGLADRPWTVNVVGHRYSPSTAQVRDPAQRADAGHEEVLAAAQNVERLDTVEATPDRRSRNGEERAFLLPTNDRVPLLADADEIPFLDPLLLQEFHRGRRPGADEQEDGATRDLISLRGEVGRIVGWTVRRA